MKDERDVFDRIETKIQHIKCMLVVIFVLLVLTLAKTP
jgi:hypothetical protein